MAVYSDVHSCNSFLTRCIACYSQAITVRTHIGSLFEPDCEAIFEPNPISFFPVGRSSGQVEELAKTVPTIDMGIWRDTVADSLARVNS